MPTIITVDGPSGAGKGTVCRILANKLGFQLLDSGAIYRLAALAALRENIDLADETRLSELASNLDIQFVAKAETTNALLNGEDVSLAIREEATGIAASKIAPLPDVRAALLDRQRAFAMDSLVADGRDMGTVVFPEAQNKFYLTASAEERARRRVLQLEESGSDCQYEVVLADIQDRDYRDMNRATAPLKAADDALIIDSSDLSIAEVVALCLSHLKD